MLTDRVFGSSETYTKNPDYWGYDEKYPENRLPYVDEYRRLVIKEAGAVIAALRSGKIDVMGRGDGGELADYEVIASVMRTNPEIAWSPIGARNTMSIAPDVRKLPFDDVRVRKAMQMALDLETVNETFLKGLGDPIPKGTVGLPGYFIPYDEWPQQVKDGFAYNPEGAEALLDAAGLTRGADGIRFTVTLHYSGDVSYKELAQAYWSDIGVDVKLKMTTGTEHHALVRERSHDMISTVLGIKADPFYTVSFAHSEDVDNKPAVNDPVYDAMYEAAEKATSFEQLKKMIKEMDMYSIERFWRIWGPEAPLFTVTQPWVTGYGGEGGMGGLQVQTIFARLWIDSAMKKEMGH
jgi:peptide/nickel transport system substrate-binding protein